jgi:transposase
MTQQLSTVAIDLAKKVFHLVGADTTGKILWRTRLTRQALMPFIAQLPPVLIGMEACGGAHDWATNRARRSFTSARTEDDRVGSV